MATPTEAKHAKKEAGGDGTNTRQLVFPLDYMTENKTNAGSLVVFQINRISGSKLSKQTNIANLSDSADLFKGLYGNEVAMQGQAGLGSVRSKDGTDDWKRFGPGNVYEPSGESIVLPFPANYNISQNSQWNSTEMGMLARTMDAANSLADGNGKVLQDQLIRSLGQAAAGAVQKLGIAKAQDMLELYTGVMQNPYSEVLFRGMSNRTIPLQYILTPRNYKEAIALRNLIHRFRFHQCPEMKYSQGSKNAAYLVAPSTFDIHFIDAKTGRHNEWVPKVSTCALTSITVNGTPNGEYSITRDGQFTSVTLELNFLELTLLLKEMMTDPTSSY